MAFSLLFLGAFFYWAVHEGDPHLFSRGGALLAAVGALCVVYQVRREVLYERKAREIDRIRGLSGNSAAEELRLKALATVLENMHGRRLGLVLGIAIVVFLGELVHGWGDLVIVQIGADTTHSIPE